MAIDHPTHSPSHTDPLSPAENMAAYPPHFSHGVSWSAVFAGGIAAASLSLILLLLGAGFGLSAVSPWSGEGIEGDTFGWSAIAWVTFMSLAASGVGGYMAGRLRKRWLNVRTDEVYFRDTAHGLLAWGLSTLAMATLLTSVTGAIVTGGAKAGADAIGGVTSAASAAAISASAGGDNTDAQTSNPLEYFVDTLFRDDRAAQGDATAENRAERSGEVARIFMNALAQDGELDTDDQRYVARLIAQNTTLTQQQAEARVTEVYERTQQRLEELETSAREAAETARKASAYISLWLSVALLIGAFVASLAATWGGRQRDY